MEIKFQMTEEDFIQFNLYHMENSPSQKKLFYLSRYLLPLMFSVIIYIAGTLIFKQPSLFWIIVALIFLIFWMINYPKQYKRYITKQVRKMLNEGDNTSVFTEKTLSINTDQLKVIDQFSSNTISKENVKDVKVYDDMFLIYVSSITAEIIPTRYLNDKSKKVLLDFFEEKINL